MPYEFQGTVTQKSNGQIVITPKQDSKRLPAMGDDVTVTISVEVTQPVEKSPSTAEVAEAERAARKAKAKDI